jgi:ABC-type multidrug transport system ATPase subunit
MRGRIREAGSIDMKPSEGLTVEGLTRRFGSLVAVDDLSFEVHPGEILGVLGPNGAGKTTALLCLAGLIRPNAGTIRWDGQVLGPERGSRIALIPETPDVYPMLTVWEHLVFTAQSCRLGPDWMERGQTLLERFALMDERDTLGEALSKGMRQKTLLAATLLAETRVLLLDEPMIGLDPRGQRELRELLREARDQGTAIVMSTHLLDTAESLCDRLLVLHHGRAVATGCAAELRQRGEGGKSLEDVFLEVTQ